MLTRPRIRVLQETRTLHEALTIKEDSLYRLETSLSEKSDYIKTVEHILDIHRSTHTELQAKHVALQKDMNKKQNELDALHERLEEAARRRKHDVEQAEQQRDQDRAELNDLRQSYVSKTRLLIQVGKDIDHLKETHAKKERDNEVLQEKLKKKEDDLVQIKQCLIKLLDHGCPEALTADLLSRMQSILDGLNKRS